MFPVKYAMDPNTPWAPKHIMVGSEGRQAPHSVDLPRFGWGCGLREKLVLGPLGPIL